MTRRAYQHGVWLVDHKKRCFDMSGLSRLSYIKQGPTPQIALLRLDLECFDHGRDQLLNCPIVLFNNCVHVYDCAHASDVSRTHCLSFLRLLFEKLQADHLAVPNTAPYNVR